MSGVVLTRTRRLLSSLRAWSRAAPLIALVAAAPLAAQTPDSAIENTAVAGYRDANGNTGESQGQSVILLGTGEAGMELSKSVDRADAVYGDTVTYTLSWHNTGSGAIRSLIVTDTLPASLTFVNGSVVADVGLTTQATGRVLTFTLEDDVAAGASGSLTFAAVVEHRSGTSRNVAHASFESDTGTLGVSSGTTEMSLTDAAADMHIVKVADRAAAVTGDTINYTISWTNQGQGFASQMAIVDSLPAMVHVVDGSITATHGTAALAGSVLTVTVDSIAPGGIGSVQIAAVVAAADGMIHNRAFAEYLSQQTQQSAASDTVATQILPPAALSLEKLVDRAAANPGDTLTYTLRWTNAGGGVAEDIAITDSLPAGVAFVAAVMPSGVTHAVSGSQLTFNIAEVAAGATDSVQITALVRDVGAGIVTSVMNVAAAAYTSAGASANTTSDTVRTTVEAKQMRLEIEALVDGPLHVGDTLTYLIRLINPTTATPIYNVALTDSLPDELEFMSAQPTQTGAASGGLLTWHFDVLAPGDTAMIYVRTVVRGIGNGELVNMARATDGALNHALAASASVVVLSAGLEVRRSTTALEVGTGEAVGYTITVENTGAVELANVIMHDAPGTGFSLHRGTVSGGVLESDGNVLRFALGTLAPGASVTVQFVATLDGARGHVVENRAWAFAGGVYSDTASASVRLRGATLATQLVMGRVWLDDNGDGRQQQGERPLAHAVVWLAAGQTVRADTLGRFTLPDLATGRHTLRVDPLSIPVGYVNSDPVSVRVDGFSSPVVGFAIRRDTIAIAAAVPDSMSAGFLFGAGNIVPRPRFAAPAAGAVIGTNRLFLRLEGEPSASVRLYDNDRELESTTLRGDGSQDFIGVSVEPGPHVFDAVISGAAGDQKISVDVHVSGAVDSVERADAVALRAGTPQRLVLRVLDEWGVPVAQRPYLTLGGTNVRLAEPDADASSVGHQLPVGENGMLIVPVIADSAGVSLLHVSYGDMRAQVALQFLPQIRSLVVVGSGEVGIGAAPDMAGSVVARGSLDDQTAVTLSYDSRRTSANAFGGAFDPLDESHYPVLGDASESTVLGSATTPLSVRVERDRSWLLLGDIDTRGFGADASPGAYHRALPGASGLWTNGALDIVGFGAMASQQLVQKQIVGNGTSGPYYLGGPVRLGTDRLIIETRDRLNASLVLSQQELERFVDYDIDPSTGAVLLRRPLLSQDVNGNPLVLVALAEQINGASAFVGGARATLAITPFTSVADSVGISVGYIEDSNLLGAHRMVTGEMGGTTSWGGTNLEFARVAHQDSAGMAFRSLAWLGSRTATGLTLEWSHTDDSFFNPANPRLIAGTEDFRLDGRLLVGEAWKARGSYSYQSFRSAGAARERTALGVTRSLGERTLSLDLGVQKEMLERDTVQSEMTSATSRVTLASGRDALWLEAVQPLRSVGGVERPATYGVGASYEVMKGIGVEAAHRLIRSDSATDGLTTLGLRTEFSTGTRVWSEYQLLENVSGRSSAGLVGIGQNLKLTSKWSIDAQYERRAGLSELPATDPAHALPLATTQQEYWSASAGTEWTPSAGVRASLRGELTDGAETGRGHRVLGNVEAALSPSWTLFGRQDSRASHRSTTDGPIRSSASRSILAAAFRPAASSVWNSLFKLEYRNDENPQRAGGTLLSGTDRRVIGAVETIWTPETGTELGVRFALRRAALGGLLEDAAEVTAHTQFVGVRASRDITDRVDVRAAARLLAEHESGLRRWDFAPAIGVALVQGLELEAGYRFGDLRDADFSQSGGNGVYLSLGMSFTELSGKAIADFWRGRMDGGR